MRLKSIKLRNFLSYARQEFDFISDPQEKPSIFVISGINRDSSNSDDNSNGSGKSTLVGESVSFNLFGKNLRGSSKKIKLENAIKFGEGTLVNEVEYFVDQTSVLNIRREKERDGKSKLSINVDGETKSKRLKRLSEDDIREFLGIDPEVYYQTISYYKDNISLLSMNYSQRLDFFKKLVNLDLLDEYYQKIKKYKTELDKKISTAKIKRKAQEDIIEALNSNDSKYVDIVKEAIEVLKSELNEVNNKEEKSEEKYKDKLDKVMEIKEEIDSEITELSNQNRIDKAKAKELQQEIKNFSKLKNTNCPTCNQPVAGEYADSIISTKTEFLDSLEKNIEIKEEKIESLSEKILKINDKENRIRKEIDKIKSENTIRKVQIQSLNKQIQDKEKELSTILKAIENKEETNEYQENIRKLDKVLDILERKKEINDFWLENLATKSPVRSAIIRKHINILSDTFEYYLGKLFRNTIVGRMEIDDEGNIDILLSSDNHEVNYWNLSSGEKKRADIAVLFSLFWYILHIVPNAPQFLILDEIFDSLDEVGKTYVTEAIADIYNRYQIDIFIISHVDFPKMVFEDLSVKNIVVVKEDGASTASYVENF